MAGKSRTLATVLEPFTLKISKEKETEAYSGFA